MVACQNFIQPKCVYSALLTLFHFIVTFFRTTGDPRCTAVIRHLPRSQFKRSARYDLLAFFRSFKSSISGDHFVLITFEAPRSFIGQWPAATFVARSHGDGRPALMIDFHHSIPVAHGRFTSSVLQSSRPVSVIRT